MSEPIQKPIDDIKVMRKRKLTLFIIVIIFLLLLLFIKISEVNLVNHGILLNAKTTEWGVSAKMGLDLNYEFYYKGEKNIRSNAFGSIRGNTAFCNKYFPVMYDPKLGTTQLLIEPSDFREFNLPFPDSLKWVLKYTNR